MSIGFKHKGSFQNLERYLNRHKSLDLARILDKYGRQGVAKLSAATPKDTGEAADSWYYDVIKTREGYKLAFSNSKMAGSVPLVVLLQYGHGTTGGTFVPGNDFINPALRPVVEQLSQDLWKEVKYE